MIDQKTQFDILQSFTTHLIDQMPPEQIRKTAIQLFQELYYTQGGINFNQLLHDVKQELHEPYKVLSFLEEHGLTESQIKDFI